MKQQALEKLVRMFIHYQGDYATTNALHRKAEILLEGGDKSASVVREILNWNLPSH